MRDIRVLFFGDSFVAGVGDPEGRGWVGRVTAAAFADGIPVTAYNLGVRRETSADVRRRWQAEAQARILPEADCRVLFSFGTNDTMIERGAQRLSPAESVANLVEVVAEAQRLQLPVFVVGPPPVGDPKQIRRIAELSERFAASASKQAIPYVNLVEPLRTSPTWAREVEAGDGAHPAGGGYALLAEVVMKPWLAWLVGGV